MIKDPKVGMGVEVGEDNPHRAGEAGKIISLDSDSVPVKVRFVDGRTWWYQKDSLTEIKEEAMKYTRDQIKESLKTSRAKWVIPSKDEKVLRSNEKCGFCEMVGNNFDITGGKNDDACTECCNIFWGEDICLKPIMECIDEHSIDSEDSEWPEACKIMQSEFDRIEKEFCAPEVYEVECEWRIGEGNNIVPTIHGWSEKFNKKYSADLVGKRTKLTIEVLD